MSEPKRLLVAGDTHGDSVHLRYLFNIAHGNQADAIFIVGDFGYWEHERDGVEFLDDLDEVAGRFGIPVYFLDGNHDKTSLLLEKYSHRLVDEGFMEVRENIAYAPRGHRWTWNGVRFIALGGAYSVDKPYRLMLEAQKHSPERYWFPEEEMTDEELTAILEADSSPVDVMLTHDKPRGSRPQWNRKDLEECWPNQDRIQRAVLTLEPTALIHGHLHYRYNDTLYYSEATNDGLRGYQTTVIGLDCNVSAQDSPRDISLDLSRGERTWVLLDLHEQWELTSIS